MHLTPIGYALKMRGDPALYPEAEQYYLLAYDIRRCEHIPFIFVLFSPYFRLKSVLYSELLGDSHADTIVSMNNLAEIFAAQGIVCCARVYIVT